jgi:hypothetical protein
MGSYTVIHPDGREQIHRGWNALPSRESMQATVGGDIEYVHVLHKGKRTFMVVNEIGATDLKPGYPLPVNPKATEIYWAASRARGASVEGAPHIHGVAILFEGIPLP